jgi:hypothetical protein
MFKIKDQIWHVSFVDLYELTCSSTSSENLHIDLSRSEKMEVLTLRKNLIVFEEAEPPEGMGQMG